jgi:hypothetical protein
MWYPVVRQAPAGSGGAPGWPQTVLAVAMPPSGIFLGSLLGAAVWLLYARRSARGTRYRCGRCDAEFPISTWTAFASLRVPHDGRLWRLLKCPRGGHLSWAAEARSVANPGDRNT